MPTERKSLGTEFKEFVLRGNVVDLAVAVVIGAAFGAVVTALVKDLITPLIGIPGKTDFSTLTFQINGSVFRYGDFINAVIAFVMIAAAVFFFVVKPLNYLLERRKRALAAGDTETKEALPADVVLLTEIRDLLRGARSTPD